MCVLAIPGVVFAGVGGIYASRHDWPGMFGVLLAPVPSIIVVFLQRVKASSRRKLKGACGGLGWGFEAGQGGESVRSISFVGLFS